MSPRVVATGLIAATIAGALLRLLGLTFESLWIDEIWSGHVVSGSFAEVIPRLIRDDIHPPLFHLIQWPFPRIFSVDAGLRLPSAIVGILSIPLIFAVGRRLFDERVGLVAAALLALSPFAVHASREARFYSLLLFLSLLATFAFLRLRTRKDHRSALLLGLALAAMLYTQYMGALFIAALLLAAFLEGGRVRRGAILAGGVAFLLFAPWVVAARPGFGNVAGYSWIPSPTTNTVTAAIGGLTVLGRSPWSWSPIPAVALMILWLVFVVRGASGKNDRTAVRLCLLLFAGPVLANLAISMVRPVFLARALIPIVPPILLLGARGALSLPRPKLAAAVLIASLLPGALWLHLEDQKEDWRGAIGYLAAEIEPGEPIVVDPFHSKAVVHYGYGDPKVRDAPIILLPSRETVKDVPALIRERLGREPESFWLVIRTFDWEDVETHDIATRSHDITASYVRNGAAAIRLTDRARR